MLKAISEDIQTMLRECEKEQIHLISSIQPHGYFLAFHRNDQTITHYATHIRDLSHNEIILHETTVADILGIEAAQAVAKATPFEGGYVTPWIELTWKRQKKRCFGLLFKTANDDILGLDLEFYDHAQMIAINRVRLLVYSELSRLIHDAVDRKQLNQRFVQALKDTLHYDRVMVYHFDEDWNGEVVAEAREAMMTPYLGLHWPASDIPTQVRELMLLNRCRHIVDRDYQPVPIASESAQPIDQSLGSLRSVSPVHLLYLRNMEVQSSLTLPLITDDKLWGLVACHHRQVKRIDPMSRMVCEQLTEFLAQKSLQLHHLDEMRAMQQMESRKRSLIRAMEKTTEMCGFIEKYISKIRKIVPSDGLVLIYNGRIFQENISLPEGDLNLLISTLQAMKQSHSVVSKNISTLVPQANFQGLAGIAAFPLSTDKSSWIAWFRSEYRKTVRWAGDRNQPLKIQNGQILLEPRASFAVWREKKKGQALAWKDCEVTIMQQLAASLIYMIAYENEVLAKRLMHEAAELQHKNEDLRQFSYIASHDLKSPISAIAGFCQILAEKEAPRFSEKGIHYLHRIQEQTKYMSNLIDNLLAYSLAYHLHTKFETVDLKKLCEDVSSQFQIEIDRLHARLEIDDLPVIFGDETQLRQLFSNFLQNSLKFASTERSLVVQVRAERKNTGWLIQWIDNGIGIPEESRKKVFEWFSRDTRRKFTPGSGIGLSICKRIVEQHHGEIWIEQADVVGTNVSVMFPDRQPQLAVQA